jgi:hypothetical protein
MNGRYIHVVWCDDIRLEIGSKRSFMGVYGPILYVNEMPAVLSKLCVWITFRTPYAEPLKSLVFRVLDDDDVMVDAPMDDEQLKAAFAQHVPGDEAADASVGIEVQLVISPFKIDAPKALRVRVIADGVEYKGARLKIETGPITQ